MAPLRNAQSESFVEASADGQVLLACLHGEFKEPSIMFASTDGGQSWRELEATPTPATGGDCEVAQTTRGWHFIHTQAVGITVASTFDEGGSWHVDPLAGPPVASFSDRAWLEGAGDVLALSYSGYLGITARMSRDAGASWEAPQVVVRSPPGMLSMSGHLELAPDGLRVLQPYAHVPPGDAEATSEAVQLGVALSEDGGATWADRPLPGPVTAYAVHPAATMAADGAILLSAYVGPATDSAFTVWRSVDGGRSWSEPRALLEDLAGPARAWAAARPDGLVDLLVQADGTTMGTGDEETTLALVRFDPATDSAPFVHPIAPAREEFACVDHDAAGRAVIVFTRGGGDVTGGPTAGSTLWLVTES